MSDVSRRNREACSEVRYGSWPNQVGVLREAGLSEDLSAIDYRRVVAVRIRDQNEIALTLSRDAALDLYHALGDALIASTDRANMAPDDEPLAEWERQLLAKQEGE